GISLCVVAFIASIVTVIFVRPADVGTPRAAGSSTMPRATNSPTIHDAKWDQLSADLSGVVTSAAAAGITMSISVTDLSRASCRAGLVLGNDKRVEAASLIKLGILVVLMDKIDRGQLKLGQLVHVAAGSDDIVGGTGT